MGSELRLSPGTSDTCFYMLRWPCFCNDTVTNSIENCIVKYKSLHLLPLQKDSKNEAVDRPQILELGNGLCDYSQILEYKTELTLLLSPQDYIATQGIYYSYESPTLKHTLIK